MIVRGILALLLGYACSGLQAGNLPNPQQPGGLHTSSSRSVAGMAAFQAAKKICRTVTEPATGKRWLKCDGVSLPTGEQLIDGNCPLK